MLYAAVLQKYLYETSPCHDNQPSACETPAEEPNPSPLNVWIISGPYILVGIAEIFASITSLEYAFTKVGHLSKKSPSSDVLADFFFSKIE